MKKLLLITLTVSLVAAPASAATVQLPSYCTDINPSMGALVACRLHVSRLVGIDKARTGVAIEDKQREAVVIGNGVKLATGLPVPAERVEAWWMAQITASKLIQSQYIGAVQRVGITPPSNTPTVAQLRGVLDGITQYMTARLPTACREQVLWDALSVDQRVNVAALWVAVKPLPACAINREDMGY